MRRSALVVLNETLRVTTETASVWSHCLRRESKRPRALLKHPEQLSADLPKSKKTFKDHLTVPETPSTATNKTSLLPEMLAEGGYHAMQPPTPPHVTASLVHRGRAGEWQDQKDSLGFLPPGRLQASRRSSLTLSSLPEHAGDSTYC